LRCNDVKLIGFTADQVAKLIRTSLVRNGSANLVVYRYLSLNLLHHLYGTLFSGPHGNERHGPHWQLGMLPPSKSALVLSVTEATS
jgi:hypothetical protein